MWASLRRADCVRANTADRGLRGIAVRIRKASRDDDSAVRSVHLAAFPDEEAAHVAALASNLLAGEFAGRVSSWVAECNGQIVGHVAFSQVMTDDPAVAQGYILAPLGVLPRFQRQSVGTQLVRHGIDLLVSGGDARFVLVYGDPAYYSRFGFSAESAACFVPPFMLSHPEGWQALLSPSCPSPSTPVNLTCVAPLMEPGYW
jgi:putative acetyltransferase